MHSISEMVVTLLDLAMSCFRVCVPVSDQMALTASLPVSDDSPELPDRDAEVQLEEPRQELQRSRRSGSRLFSLLEIFSFLKPVPNLGVRFGCEQSSNLGCGWE